MWRQLWWKMADGVKSEYDKIKATETIEFYELFDLWREKLRQERETFKQKKAQRDGRK